MSLKELADSIELPPTRVADTAWPLARRRLRRRRVLAAGGTVLVVGVALAFGAQLDLRGSAEPAPSTHTPSPAPTTEEPGLQVTEKMTDRRLTERGYYTVARGPLIDMSPKFSTPLSQAPIPYAALAIGNPDHRTLVEVLGPAGEIRTVDVPGLVPVRDSGGYKSGILRTTSLSPDATRLALPQPHSVVVVDLARGDSQRIATPGLNYYADWLDNRHVYVAAEDGSDAVTVDPDSGSVEPSDRSPGEMDGSFFSTTPLVGRDLVVRPHGVASYSPASHGARLGTVGMLALDRSDGHPVGFLATTRGAATDAQAIGWYQGLPVVSFTPEQESVPMRWLITWDPRTREITPLATLYASEVAWGRGLTPATLP
jgi:hypothetical protein